MTLSGTEVSADSRRRRVLAASVPALVVLAMGFGLVLVDQVGRGASVGALAHPILLLAALSLGPFAALENLPASGALVLTGVGWSTWLILVRRTRIGDAPTLVHLLAPCFWLGVGLVLVLAQSIQV
jgi:hypothetical protein